MRRWPRNWMCVGAALGLTLTAHAQLQESPDAMLQRGLTLFGQGAFEPAAATLQALVDRFGNEPSLKEPLEIVYYGLGSSYYNLQRYGPSVDAYREYLTRYPRGRFVEEVMFRIGSALQLLDRTQDAEEAFLTLLRQAPQSIFAEDAALQVAMSRLIAGESAAAAQAFEAFLRRYPTSALAGEARMYLAKARAEGGDPEGALTLVDELQAAGGRVELAAYASLLALEIGDGAYQDTRYDLALRAFRRVRTQASLIAAQENLIRRLEDQMDILRRQRVGLEDRAAHFQRMRRAHASLGRAQAMLETLRDSPAYDDGLFHRIGRCFFNAGRFWEARVAFERVMAEAEEPAVREAAHFDLVLVYGQLRAFDRVAEEADRYLEIYGDDPAFAERVPTVAFLRGESFLNRGEFEATETEMADLLRRFPSHPMRARIEFYLHLSQAMQEKFAEAIEGFRRWRREHPRDVLRGEVAYWLPTAMFYDRRYEEADPLYREFAAAYPQSVYTAEALYRAALCRYALEDFAAAADELGRWVETYPDHRFAADARITRGDALAALGRVTEAIAAYRSVGREAGADLRHLALRQYHTAAEALNDPDVWRTFTRTCREFMQDHPESPNLVDVARRVGQVARRMGDIELARREYWNVVDRFGERLDWEGFGPLLRDLAALYSGPQRDQFLFELDERIRRTTEAGQQTAEARLRLTRLRADPGPSELRTAQIVADAVPLARLGPDVLAVLGQAFVDAGNRTRAQPYLDRLLERFPDSRSAAVAYLDQARQALADRDAARALRLAEIALGRADEQDMMIRAAQVRAQAHLAEGNYDEAEETLTFLVANRATPHPMRAQALLDLAAVQEGRGDWSRAMPYYQRIYVMYRAFPETMAAAYLRSARVFERLQQRQEAINTYVEMLDAEELEGRPELEEARRELARLRGAAT